MYPHLLSDPQYEALVFLNATEGRKLVVTKHPSGHVERDLVTSMQEREAVHTSIDGRAAHGLFKRKYVRAIEEPNPSDEFLGHFEISERGRRALELERCLRREEMGLEVNDREEKAA